MKIKNLIAATICLAVTLLAPRALATANYVYHERTANDITGGNANTCGGPLPYVTILNPSSSQTYELRFKVEFQFFTDTLKVYYTTDGSTPAGALGVGSGTTLVVNGAYVCTFTQGADTVDVCTATIPAQPAGTVVKYLVSAWHSGGGPEIFANSGTCGGCGNCQLSTCATNFQYTVLSSPRYWDTNGATAGASGGATAPGIWDTGTTLNWSTDPNGSSSTIAWTPGEDAIFSAGANASGSFTVTIPASTTNRANSVTVQEGTILLGPGTLNFGSVNGIIDVASGATLNISGAGSGFLTGSGGLTKNGPGTLFLGGTEQYSAPSGAILTVNAGTADFSGDLALGAAPGANNNAAITLNGGTLRYSGSGALTLAATRGTTIGSSGATIEVTASAATLTLNGTVGNALLAGTGLLTKSGAGRLTLNNSGSTFSGKWRMTGGDVNVVGDTRFGPVPGSVIPDYFTLDGGGIRLGLTTGITISANRGVTLGAAGGTFNSPGGGVSTFTYNGIIAGTLGGGFTANQGGANGGIVILGGANTYNGATTVAANTTLRLGAAAVIPDTSVVTVTGLLDLNNFNETIGGLAGAGVVTNGTAGTRTLTINQADARTFSGILKTGTGDLNLVKQGAGVLTLSGANTYTGTTTIESGGAIKISNATALGASGAGQGTTVNSGAQLQTSGTINSAEPLTLNGTGINNDGTGTILVTANGATFSGGITLGTGVRLQNNGAASTVSGGITGVGFDLAFGGSSGWTVNTTAINIGGGTLTKDGGATTILRLDTANTIGAINLNAGGLNVGNAGCFGSATITVGSGIGTPVDTGGILAVGSLGTVNINNNILLSSGAVCGLAPASSTVLNFAGTISGNGGLRRTRIGGTGAGTTMLSGANDFAGGLVHATDPLVLNHKSALGTGTYSIGDNLIAITAQPPNISANTTLTGVDAVANPITINTNAFTWSGANDLEFSGPVTLAASPTITVLSTAASIFSGGISGTGFGITKAGSGKLTLNGNNTYNGATLVSLGTLLVNGSLPNSAATVASGATLAGNGALGGLVTVQTGGNLSPGASIGTLTLATEPSLSGNTVMEINRTGLSLTNDQLVLTTGTLTYGGQLIVTLLGGSDALVGGNTFALFAAPAFAGAFAGFTLPTLPTGLAWDTSQLTVNGSISVVCTATPVANAGNDQTNCVGVGVQIGGSPTATGGTAPYTFSWSPATGLSSTTDANPTATPATTTTYTVIATDANGCSSLGDSVTITVDTAAPAITCPTDVTVQCLSAVPTPDFSGGTVSDNTDPSPVVTHVGDVTNGVNPLIITRTYKATDSCTNEATCTQTITVQDTIAPVASCTNITVLLVGGTATITPADVNNGSSDNCALNLVSVQPNTFTSANLGPNNVTLTVSDNSEHTNTCVAIVTVSDIVLVTNRYDVQASALATGKPEFSPPHGTGTNSFGYDWDSAAPNVAEGAPIGYGCASFSASVAQAGVTEPDRYRTFRIGLRTLFGRNVTVGEVTAINYQTKKTTPQTAVDWRISLYTTPQGAGDAGSFYRSRIQATPYNALGLNAPANQWNTWTTGAGVNQFQFMEKRADFNTENIQWSEIISGPVTRGSTTWDWTDEEVMMIDITLGANTGGGDATSQLDAVQIHLTDGTTADINLEGPVSYSTVYVDDSYTGLTDGTPVTFPNGAGGPSHVIGCDAFATIQGGVSAVAGSGTVNVAAGSYLEDVTVNQTISILGAGAGQSLVYGATNGGSATFQIAAAGVVLDGFSISRDGNNPTDWNGPLNLAGVAIQGLGANATVRNCWFEGNRTAIDINFSAGNVIANNVLTNNRTGLIFRNDCQNNLVTNNAIVDNWTVGVLWIDTGISGLAQGTVLSRNNISGNWYGQIVDRRVTAGTFDLWNCSANWLGSAALVITTANSAEPGYAAQIPVVYGGSATPPGGAPNLAGPGVANIDYTPWLDNGADTSATFGFQGDFTTLHVDDNSQQVGPVTRIQEGVNSVSGSTVLIAAGDYTENIVISSKVSLIGAGSGTTASDTVITAADGTQPVILVDDAGGAGAGDRLTLKDLRVRGASTSDGVRLRATTAPRSFYRLENVASVQNPSGAGLQVEGPQNVSNIEVVNCALDNNNFGLVLGTSIPVFDGLSVTGGEVKNNSTLGLIVNPLGSDATDATTDYSNITVDGTAFANNGNAIFAGSGHLVFFRFNGNATVKNVTMSGPTWCPIQFRGEGVDATPGTWQPSGTILLQNVLIGGSGIRPGLYIQDYSAVSGFTLDNVNLGGYLPPDVSGPNGFFAQAMQVRHTGAVKMNLGKLTLPSTVTYSGFLPVSGYYALALTATGGAQAACDTVILGATTTQALEDAVFDGDDTALMAALSIPPGSIGDVAFPALSVSCPANVTQGCSTPGGTTITFPPATAAGDCVPGTPSCLPASGSTFAVGTTVVTCSVTDARGITANCTFNVTVLADTNAPVINCPAPIVVNANSGQCGKSNVIFTVTATDACDATPTVVSTPASGSTFPVGTTTVTSVAMDDAGNTNSCSFTVTVIDDQLPLIVCSTNIVVTNGFGLCSAVVTFTTNATDNCTVTNLVSTPPSGSAFPVGTTTVTNIATDASGNSSTCTFTVTVIDNQAPALSCPTNISVTANSGLCAATNVNLGAPAASDNCAVTSLTNNGPAVYLAGTTPVVWSAWDASGNSTTCTQMVTVIDTQPPTITCSTNRIVEASSTTGTPVFFATTATDNCGPVTKFCSIESGGLFGLGITTVNCAAFDPSLNASVCFFDVTVIDTTAPVISCPTNQTVGCNRTNGAVVDFTVGAIDLGDSNVIVTANPPSGTTFPFGTTTVFCTASDHSGNTNTCSFTITVVEAPILLSIQRQGTNVVLSWPVTCASYVLQETPNLNTPITWTLSPSPVVSNFQNRVTLPHGWTNRFFRLQQQ